MWRIVSNPTLFRLVGFKTRKPQVWNQIRIPYIDEYIRSVRWWFSEFLYVSRKLKILDRVNQKRFLLTHKVYEIVVMMYWKSLKVEMAGLILGILCEKCLWVNSYNFRYMTMMMINVEVIYDIFKYVSFVHRNRVKWQQICWTGSLCFVRSAQNFMFSSYAHGVVLKITLLLTEMDIKQLNQWNKLLFIIPNWIMLHCLLRSGCCIYLLTSFEA